MTTFQDKFWGYEIDIPPDWTHKTFQDIEGFALDPNAFEPGYEGEHLGQILIRGEWNSSDRTIDALWNQHITKLSVMMGAKRLGSAPWRIGGAAGYEVEILLPKQNRRRLWAGILQKGRVILHFTVLHWKENRPDFEPLATKIISSLCFVDKVSQIDATTSGIPIIPHCPSIDPAKFIDDIKDPSLWEAYEVNNNVGALQAFYLREAKNYAWEIIEYSPFPSAELGFARLDLRKGEEQVTLGLMPVEGKKQSSRVVIKYYKDDSR